MKEETLQTICGALHRAGVGAATTAFQPRDNIRVLLTHYVDDGETHKYRGAVERLLAKRTPIDPGSLISAASESFDGVEGLQLAVTFDDGLLSSFKAAQEILNPLDIKAIFFVPTVIFDLRGESEMRDFFASNVYRYKTSLTSARCIVMSKDHVLELRQQGHLVMPHTHSHVSLASLTTESERERELVSPKAILEDLLQESLQAFAFPFGTERAVNRSAYETVRATYSCCFTGLRGVNTRRTDPHCLYRDCVQTDYPDGYIDDLFAGTFDGYYAAKMGLLKRRAGVRRSAWAS